MGEVQDFVWAIVRLKEGKLVTRKGWNGKNMFLFMRPEDQIPVKTIVENIKSIPQSVKDYYALITEHAEANIAVKFTAYICMKAADDSIVNGWLASQTDIVSSDWIEFNSKN